MRIGSSILAQRLDENELVIMDESDGSEIVLSFEESQRLAQALEILFPEA